MDAAPKSVQLASSISSDENLTESCNGFILKENLTKAVNLGNHGALVDFAWGSEMFAEKISMKYLKVNERVEVFQMPLTLNNIGTLNEMSQCRSLTDPWEIDASKVCSSTLENLNLSSLLVHNLQLPMEMKITTKLSRVILYNSENNFIHSLGSCCVEGKFGTAILQVPVEGGHEGGCLNVVYEGKKVGFENHGNSDRNFYLTSYYNCCEEFMEPVTRGKKLIFVFDLIWGNANTKIPKNFPVFLTAFKEIKQVLKTWIRQNVVKSDLMSSTSISKNQENSLDLSYHFISELLNEQMLFFVLREEYEEDPPTFEVLRGQDRVLADLFLNSNFLDVHIAMPSDVSKNESVNKEMGEEGSIAISSFIDSNHVKRNLSFQLDWNKHFVELIQSNQENEARGGNHKDKIELGKRNLHHGVLVIWPKHHSVHIYCRFGISSLMNGMEQMFNSSPKWKNEAQKSAKHDLRQLLSFCRAEPQRAWTTSGLGKGELTLRLLHYCITLGAREEGLDLLKLLSSNFDSENFEGIQNDQVAQAIADFVSQVSGWKDVVELIEPLLSCDRITKHLLPVMTLAKCLLRSNCMQGAKFVGDSVSSFFAELDQTRALKSNEFEVEAYLDMIVELETILDTCCQSRTASFILFFSKVRSSLQCRVLLYFEAQFNSQMENNHQSCKNLFYALCCKILSDNCNIYVPSVKSIIVDIVRCFIRLGNAEFLKSFISKIFRVPDTIPEGFSLVVDIISYSTVWEFTTSSKVGKCFMASLVDHHLTLMADQFLCFEDVFFDQISRPCYSKDISDVDKKALHSLSSCIWCLVAIKKNDDEVPVRNRIEWKISLIMTKLDVHQLMQLLIDVLKETKSSNKHLDSFGIYRTCQLFYARIKDQETVMPRRKAILELMNLFLQTGDETLTQAFVEHTCESEIYGIWSYHQKKKLFKGLVSSSDVWFKLSPSMQIIVLKTCVDLAISFNTTFNSMSSLYDCVQLLFDAEKNQFSHSVSSTSDIFLHLLTEISIPKRMKFLSELQLSNFPACTDWYLDQIPILDDHPSVLLKVIKAEKSKLDKLVKL